MTGRPIARQAAALAKARAAIDAPRPWADDDAAGRLVRREVGPIEFRELRSFVHIARVGSFSRAAAELHIAQSALSRQIAKLEDELRTELFVRYGRGVRLTTAGARLLERAEAVLEYVKRTGDYVSGAPDALSGHISVGMPTAVGQVLAPPVVTTFRERWPAVGLHIREGLSTSLQEWLLERRIDLAVVHNQPPLAAFDIVTLCSQEMVLVGPPGGLEEAFPNLGDGPLQFRELASAPLILPGLPHANRRAFEQAAVRYGVALRVELEVDSISLTKALIRGGMGYSILTNTAVAAEVERGELSAAPIARTQLRSTVSIATLRENRSSRLVQAMAEVVTTQLHDLVQTGAWRGQATWHDRQMDEAAPAS